MDNAPTAPTPHSGHDVAPGGRGPDHAVAPEPPHPERAGFSPAVLDEAIRFARAHETDWPRSMFTPRGEFVFTEQQGEQPPLNALLGPVFPRGGPSGMIVRDGCLAASWGDIDRADVTFSVAKSYLAILAGIALADGLIVSLDDPLASSAADDGFESAHNRPITWRHLLQQTSEWSGVLFDKPDSIDWNRQVGVTDGDLPKGMPRALRAPGTYWEYNDVRVNRLSLSLAQCFRRPLPDVLRERVLDPIGASGDWAWHGYANSTVLIDGRPVLSVPGGSHWGGGLYISSRDHMRVGELVLNDGMHRGRRVLPEGWVAQMTSPGAVNLAYGFLWWLNHGGAHFANAPHDSYFALGAGGHVIWLSPSLKLAVVARWLDRAHLNGFIALVLQALRTPA